MLQIRYIFVLVLIEFLWINCSKNHFCFNHLNLGFVQNKRRNGTVVFSSEMIGLSSCVRSCFTRGYCRYINYNRLTSTCEFVVPVCDDVSGLVMESNWNSREMDNLLKLWIKDTYGIDNQCQIHDVMYLSPSNKKICLPQGKCPIPPTIAYADSTSSNRSVGDTVSYKCRADYVEVGNPCITCLENLKWSPTNFRCDDMVDGWTCVVYTLAESNEIAKGVIAELDVCTGHDGIYTAGGDNSLYPGCDTVCWCCERKILSTK